MAKKKKKHGKKNGNNLSAAASPSAGKTVTSSGRTLNRTTPHEIPIDRLESDASSAGINLPNPDAIETPGEDEKHLRRRLQVLITAYTQEKECLDAEETALKALRSELEESKTHLDLELEQFAKDRDTLETRRKELTDREESITARETDADSGFVERRENMLKKLKDVHQKLLDRNHKLLEKSAEREQAHLEQLDNQLEQFRQNLADRRKQLEDEFARRETQIMDCENQLREKQLTLEKREREAAWAMEDAEELKKEVETHIRDRVAKQVADMEEDLAASNRDKKALRERLSNLEASLAEQEAAARLMEHKSPKEVEREINGLRSQIKRLEAELAERPTPAETEELLQLRSDKSEWERDRSKLLNENGRLKSRLERLHIEVDSQEILQERNRALEQNQNLLKTALDDLQHDLEERLDKHRDRTVFPQFVKMDEDQALNTQQSHLYRPQDGSKLDLADFVEDLRHRIGLDPKGERPELYYRQEDIRAFLGGLAMSRMHLLQGISGIGKSSLPRAFAAAVGGFCETVSVQAGWRDRNDLFGYHNAFEKRYHESSFVQALYKAQLPQWRDRFAIILLDEMNLSHPEQYAADLLDVLERDKLADRRFELMPFCPNGQAPSGLPAGRFLPLPDNVWFVGTANHDETTKDFADKTYDRSFVLELPGRPVAFDLEDRPPREPVAYKALLDAFEKSFEEHADAAENALHWMEDYLRDTMGDRFGIGWGGRLEKQIKQFVPVVLSSGGSLGEALDQMVTSRIIRKIDGRHDILEEDLDTLKETLEESWPDTNRGADAALNFIEEQQRHL